MKKFLAVMMSLCLLIGLCMPVTAYANQGETEGDFEYEVVGGYAWITEYTGIGGEVVVPAELGGHSVKGIRYGAFTEDETITSVTVSEGIEYIDGAAFYHCFALESISLPSTYMGKSEASTDDYWICYCPEFAEITIAEGNPYYKVVDNIVYNSDMTVFVLLPPADPRTTLTIPEGVEVIDVEACENCVNLEKVVMPNSVTVINSWAFSGAYSLEDINISENCEWIGQYVLMDTSVTEITIPASVNVIAEGAFYGNDMLSIIHVDPENTQYYSEDGVLYGTVWTTDTPYYEKVGLHCYPAAKDTTRFTIPEGPVVICMGAFVDADNLKNVAVSDTIGWINYWAFGECYLDRIYIPDSVQEIQSDVFTTMYEYDGVTIYGPEGSYGLTYATQNGLDFVVSNDPADMEIDNSPVIANDETGIPDENLYRVLLFYANGNGDDVLTEDEANSIEVLPAWDEGITNLKGIQYCKALTDADFGENNISDISPLTELTNLKSLVLDKNPISNFYKLAELRTLESLSLWNVGIGDISPITELTNLTYLSLWDNNIADINPLSSLTNLSYLDLEENGIEDVSALAGLTNLGYLFLSGNNISDISLLANLRNLEVFTCAENNISSIGVLENMEKIFVLDVCDNQITDISVVQNMPELTNLTISYNPIENIEVVSGLNLYALGAAGCEITDLSIISELTELEVLDLSDNNISDISVLANMPNMIELYLENNCITDISALANMTWLLVLDLSGNCITDFSVLEQLEHLEEVDIEDNAAPRNGVCQAEDGNWYYYVDGKIDYSYTGLAENEFGWWYIENGKLNWNYTGLTLYNGIWFYVENGGLNWGYTGLVQHYDAWFYVEGGRLNWDYTGLVQHYDAWFYVEGGQLNWGYTGLVQHYGAWFYVEGGQLNWGYTGLVQYYDAWFYVEGGMLNWNYTGLVQYNGVWFYVQGGQLHWGYTGLVEHYGAWFYVEGGMLNWNYTGLVQYYDAWFYVNGGQLDWSYTGLCEYNGILFYIQNGQLNWGYTGTVEYNGVIWYVENGIAIRVA